MRYLIRSWAWLSLMLAVPSCASSAPDAGPATATTPAVVPATPAPAAPASPPDAGVRASMPVVRLALRTPVSLAAESGVTAHLRDYIIEEIAAAPGDTEAYPGGSGVVMTIEIGGQSVQLSDLSEGYEGAPVAWTPNYKLTLVNHDSSAPWADVRIERITDTVESTLHSKTRVILGESIALEAPLEAVFVSHGHRMVPRGRRSPLNVGMTYQTPSQELDSPIHSLYPSDDNTWRWRNYQFRLLSHEYNSFMELEVSRLGLSALVAE